MGIAYRQTVPCHPYTPDGRGGLAPPQSLALPEGLLTKVTPTQGSCGQVWRRLRNGGGPLLTLTCTNVQFKDLTNVNPRS